MLQALVEFQCKAVNTQQTVTIIDAIHVAGVLHAITSRITRIVRVGKRMRESVSNYTLAPNASQGWSLDLARVFGFCVLMLST